LQARNPGDSQILQLIPRTILNRDFPRHLIDDYVHWLNPTTREVEFRPAVSPWTSEPSNWRLYIQKPRILKKRKSGILQKPSQDISPMRHIDPRSNTFRAVSSLLSPLESPEHIIVTHTAQTLDVSLPRLRLSFFVNKHWQLECRSIPGYIIDKTQSCGTMFGLQNKLVLCPGLTRSEEPLMPRQVIILQGEIGFQKRQDFANVWIDVDRRHGQRHEAQHVHWHKYVIDTDLGCLTNNTSLRSKLYQCYLHARTSHCLPDPLLGRTGTEEALYILRSTVCRSFQRLGPNDRELLQLISKLSPFRAYYSSHLQSAASVEWQHLPALSQHHDFVQIVHSLLDHAHALETLYDPLPGFPSRTHGVQLLLNRAACRSNLYYPSDLQTPEPLWSLIDIKYRSRDVSDLGIAQSGHVAFRTSWSIWNARPSLDHTLPELWDLMNSWGSLGPAGRGISLRYSRYWLKFNVKRDWFKIYNLCRKSVNQNHRNLRIKLSFSLSAAAYTHSASLDIVPFLIIFALDKHFHNLRPPPYLSYTLSDGLAPELTHLKNLLFKSALPISLTPAHSSEVQDFGSEREDEYDEAIQRESSVVAESILHQWPHYQSVDFREQWFNKSACNRRIKKFIQSMSRNIQLREHVLQLQNILHHYESVLIPATTPYVFSPQFITGRPYTPSYTLRDVLSRTNVPISSPDREPFHGFTIPPIGTAATEGVPRLSPQADPDSLEIVITEIRQSQQPLLRHYGNELNKSHRELLGQNASRSTQGVIPPHEFLLLYHDECTQKKDRIFSEISEALAPSQNVEKTSSIAGLWPRIIPRSILHQLAHDRISTLPDQWKSVIMRYAVSLLRYQQSLRLLELSSKQKHEDLLREIETIRNGVLVESTPDWLLVQVRPLPC
jgi:hypothetical protein